MHKILQNHLLCAFVANLKIDALYPESFCGKNLAIPKVFAFCDSAQVAMRLKIWEVLQGSQNAKLINAWKWKGQIVFEHSPQNQFIETNDCQRKNLNLKKWGKGGNTFWGNLYQKYLADRSILEILFDRLKLIKCHIVKLGSVGNKCWRYIFDMYSKYIHYLQSRGSCNVLENWCKSITCAIVHQNPSQFHESKSIHIN